MDTTPGALQWVLGLLGSSGADVGRSAAYSTGLIISVFVVGWIFKILVRRMELGKELQLSNYQVGAELRDELRVALEAMRKQCDEAKARLVDCQRRYLTERNFNRRLIAEVRRLKSSRGSPP